MKLIARLTAFATVVALSLSYAPLSSHAGAIATPNAKNCYFVRNNLPCPCPNGKQARAVARAARVTVKALGTVIGTTAVALAKADRNHSTQANSRNSSQPAETPKR